MLYAVRLNGLFLVRGDPERSSLSLLTPGLDVTESHAFSDPAWDVGWLREHCNLPTYRQYVFTHGSFCVAVFAPCGGGALPEGLTWVSATDLLNAGLDHDTLEALLLTCNGGADVTVPWLGVEGFGVYIQWAENLLCDRGIVLNSPFRQVKNAFMSSVFSAETSAGMVYLKIVSCVYVTRTGTECLLSGLYGGYPLYLGTSPDGSASLTLEMPGHDVAELDIDCLCRLLHDWSEIQLDSAGGNDHRLPDASLGRLSAGLDGLPADVERIFSLAGHFLSPDDRHRFQMNLSAVKSILTRLSAVGIPNTVCHGDIRPGNIRIVGDDAILYDWGMAFYGFPFYDVLHFFRVLRRGLTPPQMEQLKWAYLQPWQRRFSLDSLQEAWELGQQCLGYFMLDADCRWVLAILEACGGIPATGTMDGHALSCRFRSFAKVFYRFLSA